MFVFLSKYFSEYYFHERCADVFDLRIRRWSSAGRRWLSVRGKSASGLWFRCQSGGRWSWKSGGRRWGSCLEVSRRGERGGGNLWWESFERPWHSQRHGTRGAGIRTERSNWLQPRRQKGRWILHSWKLFWKLREEKNFSKKETGRRKEQSAIFINQLRVSAKSNDGSLWAPLTRGSRFDRRRSVPSSCR